MDGRPALNRVAGVAETTHSAYLTDSHEMLTLNSRPLIPLSILPSSLPYCEPFHTYQTSYECYHFRPDLMYPYHTSMSQHAHANLEIDCVRPHLLTVSTSHEGLIQYSGASVEDFP